ncbi:MAG: outer membrane beta-barrel protein [Candidatus Cryptobacteroides sp.]
MKKTLISLAAFFAFLCLGIQDSSAKGGFGILGGVNFSTMKIKEVNSSTMTQWHAGLTYKASLPLGFSIQPSVTYSVKGVKNINEVDLSVGYIEVPVSFQWGPDLLIFRPFLDVTPFIGYGINGKQTTVESSTKDIWSEGIKRLEYGLGLGVGFEIWRFQVIGRYNWNFGPIASSSSEQIQGWGDVGKAFSEQSFSGITLTVAFLFGK